MPELTQFMKHIDYRFKRTELLQLALTHSSFANEFSSPAPAASGDQNYNERLEFLGDSVLGVVVSEYLYCQYCDLPEGELSKIRALVVCEATLCQRAEAIGLGNFLRLGKGEDLTGGRTRPSILADALEAVIAAIYLDGGLAAARQFIIKNFKSCIAEAAAGRLFSDYKSALQEAVQAAGKGVVSYKIVDQTGPDHNRQFNAVALIDGKRCGTGSGRSKKSAEQQAAKRALEVFPAK